MIVVAQPDAERELLTLLRMLADFSERNRTPAPVDEWREKAIRVLRKIDRQPRRAAAGSKHVHPCGNPQCERCYGHA